MNNRTILFIITGLIMSLTSCKQTRLSFQAYETSASGHQLTPVSYSGTERAAIHIQLNPQKTFQTITGFGGAFTESSAHLLNQLSEAKRAAVLEAYFSAEGSNYSLTRTHMGSCDFSLGNYNYNPVAGDTLLEHFSIDEDRADLLPMIKKAQEISAEGFKILASPWTAPPWMKDNNSYVGGKLLPEFQDAWALYFAKYLEAYQQEGVNIWGFTVLNEPYGNGENWESMYCTPDEMVTFVNKHLAPALASRDHDVKILAYDQNRGKGLEEWAETIYRDEARAANFDGFAVHWYESTYDWFPDALNRTHEMAPDKYLIQSEACVDAEVPHWNDDAWYWKKEATDWGWDWAGPDERHLHPKYVPVYRYARDIIGCLNSWVDGWIDWNMVLDKQGGPNWAENWCVAPVIVDPEKDEVYYTPLYYTLAHFSKFIRPGAKRIHFDNSDEELMVTAAQNPDGSVAVVILNMTENTKNINLELEGKTGQTSIEGQAIQTILITV